MPLSANNIYFFISYAVAFLVFGLIGKWYLWPAIKDRAPGIALTPLLLYACLRVNGLMFLMPGLVSPELPAAFAVPVAYGDLTAAVLAPRPHLCSRQERGRAAVNVAVQHHRVARPDLCQHLNLQGSCRSDLSWCVLLPGRAQRAGYGGRACTDLRLLAPLACEVSLVDDPMK